jgi:hypothetical protein
MPLPSPGRARHPREARIYTFSPLPGYAKSSWKICLLPGGCLNCCGNVHYIFDAHTAKPSGGLCENCGPVALVLLPDGRERFE